MSGYDPMRERGLIDNLADVAACLVSLGLWDRETNYAIAQADNEPGDDR